MLELNTIIAQKSWHEGHDRERLRILWEKDPHALPILAARLALRVFPLLLVYHEQQRAWIQNESEHIISLYAALHIAYAAHHHPADDVCKSAHCAADIVEETCAAQFEFAALIAQTVYAGAYIPIAISGKTDNTIDGVIKSFMDTAASINGRDNVITDMNFLEKGSCSHQELRDMPLWLNGEIPEAFQPYYKDWPMALEKLIERERERNSDRRIITVLERITPFLKRSIEGAGYSGTFDRIDDAPDSRDHLNRAHLVDALAAPIMHPTNHGKQTIGLFGHWGVGKSSVIKQLKSKLQTKHKPAILFGEFNAWDYEHTNSFYAGITQEMLRALLETDKQKEFWSLQCPSVEKFGLMVKLRWTIASNKFFVILWLLSACFIILFLCIQNNSEIVGVVIAQESPEDSWMALLLSLFLGSPIAVKLLSLHQALRLGGHTFSFFRRPNYTQYLGTVADMERDIKALCNVRLKKDKRLVFVVEDLDRCRPENIITVLEAIKLVLDLDHVFVILAVDERMLLSALAMNYKNTCEYHPHKDPYLIARDYLGKIVQQPIHIAPPDTSSLHSYLSHLWGGEDSKKWKKILHHYRNKHMYPKANTPVFADSNASSYATLDDKATQSSLMRNGAGSLDITDMLDICDTLPQLDVVSSAAMTQEWELPPELKAAFAYWLEVFSITNPRQVKRLYNSYQYILSIPIHGSKGDSNLALQNSPYYFKLCVLCALEYIHSLSAPDSNQIRTVFLSGSTDATDYSGIQDEQRKQLIHIATLFTYEDDNPLIAQAIAMFILPMVATA